MLATDQDFSFLAGATKAQLNQFRLFRLKTPELLRPLALVHLFTGSELPENQPDAGVGYAYIGSICNSSGYDISVSAQYYRDIQLAAHEMGHNIGAPHDTDTVACKNDSGFLMNPVVNGASSFSSCSLESYEGKVLAAPDYCFKEGGDTLNCRLPQLSPNKSFEFYIDLDLSGSGANQATVALSIGNWSVTPTIGTTR